MDDYFTILNSHDIILTYNVILLVSVWNINYNNNSNINNNIANNDYSHAGVPATGTNTRRGVVSAQRRRVLQGLLEMAPIYRHQRDQRSANPRPRN